MNVSGFSSPAGSDTCRAIHSCCFWLPEDRVECFFPGYKQVNVCDPGWIKDVTVLTFPLCGNSPRNVKSVPAFGGGQCSGLLSSSHFVMKFRFSVFAKGHWWGPTPTSLLALTLKARSPTQRAAHAECEPVALW